MSEIKYRFKQFLSEIYTVRSHKNNQQMCIDCFKPRSNKNKFEVSEWVSQWVSKWVSEWVSCARLSKFFI